ncbi:MAG: hypothetical protein DLM73_06315 [Chthoniobacterales bacterium]|nr:MAG: hypothetical protein DLM73_06315 [Chthoniobacterales bacterium]
MSFDFEKMLERKRAYRQQLADRPIGEKLRLLDALCERQRSIRSSATHSESTVVREDTDAYGPGKK